jgi:N-hydroxyarylamine O-acetyltransferase
MRPMTFVPDLDAYFARIGHTGSRAPTLETLNAIVRAHVSTIPFENLDVLLGRGIDLDPAAVEQKLVHGHRGGYCFEQNSHLLHVLGALGYAAVPISARVRFGKARGFTPTRTHVFLPVELDGKSWLADVGVGGMSVTSALRLALDVEQATPHEPRRIVAEGRALFVHQAWLGDAWDDVCEFTLEEMPPIDREVANWYTSTHPRSHFRERLIATRARGDGRITIVNQELRVRDAGGRMEVTVLATPEQLLAALDEHFGLRMPPGTRFGCAGLPPDW